MGAAAGAGGGLNSQIPDYVRNAELGPENIYNPTMGTGYGGMGVQPAVMPPNMATRGGSMPGIPGFIPRPQPQQPNIFQQSSGALNQAQRTLTGLSQFQPQQMQAAQAGPTATYGGATVESTPAYGGATVEKTQAYGGATVAPAVTFGGAQVGPTSQMQAAQLGPAERMQSVGAVQAAQAPDQIAVDRLQTQDISAYMNPYQQQVIEAGQADIERQRQLASENLASQAQKAGAFGGSRQAVQEGVLAGEALRQAGQLSAQQRQAGFQQAIESGKFDIGQTQAARTLASQQGFQASQLGQQAREAAAAREQAARSGNMQAANQFAQQQAQLEQQASQANMAALNAAAAQQANLTQQAGLSSIAAQNAAAAQQAGLTQAAGITAAQQDAARAAQQAGLTQATGITAAQQDAARAAQQAGLTQAAGLSNQAAINQAIQAQAGRLQAANQANFQGQFTGAGIRQGAAGGLSGLGQQQFNIGSQIQQQQAQQGLLQQGLQQALIDAAKGQYAGFTGAPGASLSAPLAALGATPGQSTTTQTQTPGLFNYLQTLAMMPSLCWVAREVYGEDDPRWLEFRDWVVGHSPDWFFNAYDKYGARVAKIVKKVPILKSIIRPFMDAKRKSIGYE